MKKRNLQMKWTKRIVLIALLLSVAGLGKMFAQSFTVGDLNYQVNEDGVSVTVTGHINGTSATGSLVIPETVEYNGSNYSVTAIGSLAFSVCRGLTGSLTIPNSVTTISHGAFGHCSGFTGSLTIPNSVTSIGDIAFSYCSGLTGSLTIGNSVTTIGQNAFSGCSGFTGSLTIPNSVTEIDNSAFYGCSGFTGSLTIPNSVTSIGDNAFSYCSGLTGNLTIGNSVTTIGNYAFLGCNDFSSIASLSETPPSLGDDVFQYFNMGKPVYVPCGYEEEYSLVSWGGFNDFIGICGGTVTVMADPEEGGTVIGGGQVETNQLCIVTAIANEGYVFANWTINGTVVSAEAEYTFYVAGDMTLVAHFVQEGNIVFADANVKSICVANWDTNGDGELSYGEAESVNNLGSYFTYNTQIASFEELQYFIGLSSISNYAFLNCSGLSSIVLPNTVTTIGNFAFEGCSSLTGDLTIPNTVTSIGRCAFEGCSGLSGSLTIPESVATIGEYAFYSCNGFNSIICLAETPPALGEEVFGDWNTDLVVYVPCGFEEIYASIPWGGFSNFYGLCSGIVTVIAEPEEGGSVIGGGNFEGGALCTVTAIVNEGYTFENWKKNGSVISTNAEYTFTVTGDMTLVAHFVSDDNIVFANADVKTICINHWDTNGDGELSYEEAASVTNLGDYFQSNSQVTSFDELQYFTGLSSIDNCAFQNCTELTSIVLPTSLTTIGNSAFYNCTGLTSIVFPISLTSIGDWAFSGCNSLTGNLIIGDSVTTIGDFAFRSCWRFTGSLIIGNSVTSIGINAFNYCNGFSEVHYNATSCADLSSSTRPFFGCGGTLTIGDNVERIPAYMFKDSGFTGNLSIGNSVTTIGDYAFGDCSGFTGLLTIPNSVTSIGEYAFIGCYGFTGSLVIPAGLTTIGGYAFFACHGFTGSLTIPNTVTEIGYSAFYGCGGFTGSLTIPNSVTGIGYTAFGDCSGFSQIIVEEGNSVYDSRGNCNALVETSTNTLILGCKNTVISNSVTTIGDYAFYRCSGLTGSLTIPNSVTSIGQNAFSGCSGLTGSLTIPNSVNTIGYWAFSGCSGLTGSLTIPNSVTSIGYQAFSGCSGLNEAMLYNYNPPSLGSYAFSNTSFPIYVPYKSLNDYKTATNWSNYEDRIFPMAYTTISGYGVGEGNYRFIASPLVENTAPTAVDNMITETAYDLYRFDQSENDEWQNYKYPENTPNFFLTNGQGYLYANAEDVNLIFKGAFNEDDTKEVGLAYDATATFAGWNLVGNPFPVDAYANKSYYTMNEEGTAIEPNMVSSATAIPACTGVMVMAEAEGETVVFSTEAPEAATNQGCLQIELSQAVELVETPTRKQDGPSTGSVTLHDKAIVSFNAGDRLEKFVFNKENAVISIPQGGKELAIACSDKQGEIPLNFKASKNGEYTLTIHPEAVELDYLHLIDNLTGADVDLLALRQAQGPANYTFEAKTTDYASRFRLVFSGKEADGPSSGSYTFAFINNGNIIITGADAGATLQIVDMQGRIIVCCDAAHHVSTDGMTSGVYVLRLINGDDVKTQKIVIR